MEIKTAMPDVTFRRLKGGNTTTLGGQIYLTDALSWV